MKSEKNSRTSGTGLDAEIARPDFQAEPAVSPRELMIERLVNREIDRADRCQLLNQAAADPELWKAIALAFLEQQQLEQLLHSEFPASRGGERTAAGPACSKEVRDLQVPVPQALDPGDNPTIRLPATKVAEKSAGGPGRSSSGHWRWLGLAASLLVAVASGFVAGHWAPGSGSGSGSSRLATGKPGPEVETRHAGATSPDVENPAHNDYQPVAHSLLEYADPETGATARIPMLDVEDLGQQLVETLDDSIKQQLYRDGYVVEPVTTYVSGRLANDREFILPLHRLRLRPIAQ